LVALLLVQGCTEKRPGSPVEQASSPAVDSLEFVAHGNEPFWSVAVSRQGIVFREPERPDGLRGDYAAAVQEGSRLVFRTLLSDSVALPLELVLEVQPCQDSMSGKDYAYAAVARIGDRVLRGCAEHGASADPPRDPPGLGDWVVVAHRAPGVSAMTDAEATAWHGRIAHYGSALAAFGANSCPNPSYRARPTRADSLLNVAYHIAPSALGIGSRATVTMIEVRCGESPWIVPGGTLLRTPDGEMYLVWDGVFFELRRR
jgi:uncharacterized membrane protein